MLLPTLFAGLALVSDLAAAHPGHGVQEELAERAEFLAGVKRADLSHCADKLAARGVHARNVARRQQAVEDARAKRGLGKRDTDSVLAASHNRTGEGFTPNTDASLLYTGNASCVLTPEVTQGPYYVGGEFIRDDIREDQQGVDLITDYQVIDVNTCEPVPDVYLEIWHCNSTGVYSGVVASGNGDSSDESNLDNTFLRGLSKTGADGTTQMTTTFPGHYTGRATHIHILVHTNATVFANGTLGNTAYASHVGQGFFDQSLISAVEATDVYNTNTQDLTLNADDDILAQEADADVDPLYEYTLLGDSVTDGIFAWIAFGVNATDSSEVTPAAFYYEGGGVTNPDSPTMGPGGPPGASSSAPASSATATTTASA